MNEYLSLPSLTRLAWSTSHPIDSELARVNTLREGSNDEVKEHLHRLVCPPPSSTLESRGRNERAAILGMF